MSLRRDDKYCCARSLRLLHADGTDETAVLRTTVVVGAGAAGTAATVAGAGAGVVVRTMRGVGAGAAVRTVVGVGAGVVGSGAAVARGARTLAIVDADRLGWKPHTCCLPRVNLGTHVTLLSMPALMNTQPELSTYCRPVKEDGGNSAGTACGVPWAMAIPPMPDAAIAAAANTFKIFIVAPRAIIRRLPYKLF